MESAPHTDGRSASTVAATQTPAVAIHARRRLAQLSHILVASPSSFPHETCARAAIYSDVEWKLRCDLAIAYRTAYQLGWHQEIYNHITLKIPGTEVESDGPHFLINAFGMRFNEITAGNLMKVNIDGDILDKGSGTVKRNIIYIRYFDQIGI